MLLANMLPIPEAKKLRETLIDHAVDSKDHTISDAFIALLRARSDSEPGAVVERVAS